MSSKVKDISVKNHTYYFFDDTSSIKFFHPSKALQKNSYLLHWICDVKDSKYVKINSVNPLYLIFSKKMDTLKKSIKKIFSASYY